jgi:hypothetical protein
LLVLSRTWRSDYSIAACSDLLGAIARSSKQRNDFDLLKRKELIITLIVSSFLGGRWLTLVDLPRAVTTAALVVPLARRPT